jgi:hypothetical protein
MKTPKNPLHAQVQPLPGRPLPADFNEKTQNHGGNYDRRDLESLWKRPNFTGKNYENITRAAMLSNRDPEQN